MTGSDRRGRGRLHRPAARPESPAPAQCGPADCHRSENSGQGSFLRKVRGARSHREAAAGPEGSCVKAAVRARSEEHTSELQSLMRISYAVFCLKKKNKHKTKYITVTTKPTIQ